MSRERKNYIDYIRAMVIISVVFVHVGFDNITYFSVMCMTTLYVISGFLTSTSEKPLKELVVSRFKKLMLPYWVCNIIYGVFEIWRAYYFGYSDCRVWYPAFLSVMYGSSAKLPLISGVTDVVLKILPNQSNAQGVVNVILPTNCHLWFLPVMFMGSVMFFVYSRYVKKRGIADVVTIVILLGLAYIESIPTVVQFPFGIGRGFFACACMIAGLDLKHFALLEEKKRCCIMVIVSLVVVCIAFFGHAYEAAPVKSIYPLGNIWGVYLHYIGCVAATILMLFLFKIIFGKLKCKWLPDIGRNTMTIYLWHMIFLTIFGVIIVKLFKIPIEMDIFNMAFISEDYQWARVLVSALSISACMVLAGIKNIKISRM